MKHDELPTRGQIRAISDKIALEDIRDEIDRAVASMETQLEYGDGDDDWARRAQSALMIHRYTRGLIERRLMELRHDARKPKKVPDGDHGKRRQHTVMHGLSAAIMHDPLPDLDALHTADALNAAMIDIDIKRATLKAERAQEVQQYEPHMRDEAWLTRAAVALSTSGALRVQMQHKLTRLSRAEKMVDHGERQQGRTQAFVEAAKTVLTKSVWDQIWALVDAA